MPSATFHPGLRFSAWDALVLVAGGVGVGVLATYAGWMAFVVGFTVGHFFLFCNVVRLSRARELLWAGVFVSLCAGTIVGEIPGWPWTVAIALAVTVAVVLSEMRQPSYHGVGWRTINPQLPAWWEARCGEAGRVTRDSCHR
jgi:hypothetical protein